jgi:hypothetical protein
MGEIKIERSTEKSKSALLRLNLSLWAFLELGELDRSRFAHPIGEIIKVSEIFKFCYQIENFL